MCIFAVANFSAPGKEQEIPQIEYSPDGVTL